MSLTTKRPKHIDAAISDEIQNVIYIVILHRDVAICLYAENDEVQFAADVFCTSRALTAAG
jgi:hypothetical protein